MLVKGSEHMKIEKINSNQIKCVLNKNDLVSRHIKVSELAYGTDKAQELFKDMMIQASDEFGFEANDTPLMIEAVPLSSDSIMLIITKVDNPDDLDEKFSDLPTSGRKFKKKAEDEGFEPSGSTEFVPAKDIDTHEDSIDMFYVYQFDSIDAVTNATKKINDFSFTDSTLYKDEVSHIYYLTIVADDLPTWANGIIRGTLSEYGDFKNYKKTSLPFFGEHYETIVRKDAITVLSKF